MDGHCSGFNSLEKQNKELMPEKKYCIWLSNIPAPLGLKRTEGFLRILGGSTGQGKKMMAHKEITRAGFPIPTDRN